MTITTCGGDFSTDHIFSHTYDTAPLSHVTVCLTNGLFDYFVSIVFLVVFILLPDH